MTTPSPASRPTPRKDTRITGGSGPTQSCRIRRTASIWYTVGVFGGQAGFMRFDPKTQLSEFFDNAQTGRRGARR
jgi:hypothetical protein